jgi:DNA polymerase-1
MLSKTIMTDSGRIPYEAQKEARTAGNALGQSYGMLNNRAAVEFQAITLASDYSTEILPCAPIHDAQYFVIRNDIEVVKWFNDNLIPCMQWQELEELEHPTVKLGGNLEIFHPTLADKVSIPNNATAEEILDLCE